MGAGRNVGVDVDRAGLVINRRMTNSDPPSNPRKRRNAEVHLHPEIIKEDAFLRLDTVSSTRGQIEFRFRFARIEKHRLDFRKRGSGEREASDETRKTRIRSLDHIVVIILVEKKNLPHPEHTRITEVVE